MSKSKTRILISLGIATILVFYIFNFVPPAATIVASRTLGRQIFDYVLNIAIFTAVIYLGLSLFSFILRKLK